MMPYQYNPPIKFRPEGQPSIPHANKFEIIWVIRRAHGSLPNSAGVLRRSNAYMCIRGIALGGFPLRTGTNCCWRAGLKGEFYGRNSGDCDCIRTAWRWTDPRIRGHSADGLFGLYRQRYIWSSIALFRHQPSRNGRRINIFIRHSPSGLPLDFKIA